MVAFSQFVDYKDHVQFALACIGILGALVAFARWVGVPRAYRRAAHVTTALLKMPEDLRRIYSELQVNGGRTLRDAVVRIEQAVHDQQNALLATDQKLAMIADASENRRGCFETDSQGRRTYVSIGYSRLVGQPASESLGTSWIHSVHPEDRERVLEEWNASVAGERSFDMTYRKINGDHVFWVNTRATPVRDANGKITGWFGVVIVVEGEHHEPHH